MVAAQGDLGFASELYVSGDGSRELDRLRRGSVSFPEVASNGTLYVHFLNGQNEAAWEVDFDFDSQIMVVKSTDGGVRSRTPCRQRSSRTA